MDHGLFDLVKSLGKSEKRYFKLNAVRFRENELLIELFDAICYRNSFSEKQLRDKLQGKLTIKQLQKSKHRLYNLILKSMRDYYADKTIDNQINVLLQQTSFLIKKGLKKLAYKELKKVEKLASAHERYSYLLVVGNTRSQMLGNLTTEALHAEKIALLKKIENGSCYSLLHDNLTSYITSRAPVARNKEELDAVNRIVDNSYFKNEELALSHQSRFSYFNSRFFYYRFIGDINGAAEACKLFIKYFESQSHLINQNIVAYRTILNNYLVCLLESRKLKNFLPALEKLKAIPTNYKNGNNSDFVIGLKLRVHEKHLAYCLKTLQFELVTVEINSINKWLNSVTIKNDSGFELSLYRNVSVIYFILNDYSNSLKWLNRIFNYDSKELEIAKDIFSFSRILEMLICFEINNAELLISRLRSIDRFLIKESMFYPIEKDLVLFFKNIATKMDNKYLVDVQLNLLKNKLLKHSANQSEKQFLEEFDFISWVDSKLEKKPFADILQRKKKQQ